ncbi:ABC transporter permease [Rhodoferax sp.]|uniref:ABC transporter permease n=1 Tax=Rhodoferax sp. TaxID=50421 RepID=UPI00260F92EF|nr:ABC transporter permease [Rhodoferax sp.]MDD2919846.1 ABC transporter permease [Rhodoferax sp.]
MSLGHDALTLWRNRELLLVLTRRELSSRFAGSAAGVLWAYLQPLLMVAAYFLVFDVVFAMRMGDNAPTSRVGTYLVVGSLPWLSFAESLSRGANSLVEAGSLLQKNALPPVLFVARSVLAGWVVFVPLMVLLTLGYLSVAGLGWALLAIPLLLLLQGLLVLLLAYGLAILTAAVRDTQQVLGFALSVGIFLSPVLFPLSLFPQAWRWVLFANPMTALVLGYQSVLLSGAWPPWELWLVLAGWLLALALLLNVLIRRSRDELVDWL